MKALHMEFFKCRHRMIWLPPLLMLAAQMAWGLWSYIDMDARALSQGWADMLYTFPLLNAMMTPVVAAVMASRIADIEHKGQTLKLLYTVQRTGTLFDAKFICAAAYMTAFVALQFATMVAFGMLRGFVGAPPWQHLLEYGIGTWGVTLTIMLMQLVLSMLIPNQMIGMIIGLIGALLGLFSMFLPPIFQKMFIWAYYAVLYNTAMDWNEATQIATYYYVDFDWSGLVLLAVFFAVIYCAGRFLFRKKEV